MADFSSNSEKEDSDVDAIITQAKDLVVLEQISSINLSGVSEDSVLPTDLETRFRKLKSFPETKSKHQFRPSHPNPQIEAELPKSNPSETGESPQVPDLKNSETGPQFHDLKSSETGDPDRHRNSSKSISSPSSSSSSSVSSTNSPSKARSPPREAVCCFWCSPKRVSSRKKCKENRAPKKLDWGEINNDGDLEFLSDLSIFSEKEQKRRLKKVLKEEEKISREAEKIVQWAKQASARMNNINSEIEEDFVFGSDDEIFK